jgi:hypothetical protein
LQAGEPPSVLPAPACGGAATGLQSCSDILSDTTERVVYVADFIGQSVRVFTQFANGDKAPIRVVTNEAWVGQPNHLELIKQHNELIVANNYLIIHDAQVSR